MARRSRGKPHRLEVLSERGVAREYGLSRETIRDARHNLELAAHRIGTRKLTYFRSDVEAWIRAKVVNSNAHARALADRLSSVEGERLR
jgi:predicted DNA-binding transcriptional regulator AlpA